MKGTEINENKSKEYCVKINDTRLIKHQLMQELLSQVKKSAFYPMSNKEEPKV